MITSVINYCLAILNVSHIYFSHRYNLWSCKRLYSNALLWKYILTKVRLFGTFIPIDLSENVICLDWLSLANRIIQWKFQSPSKLSSCPVGRNKAFVEIVLLTGNTFETYLASRRSFHWVQLHKIFKQCDSNSAINWA